MPPLRAVLAAGESPKDLLEAIMAGLKACGDRFEKGEYFLPELMGAGDAFKAGMGILAPKLSAGDRVPQGTVQGDVHHIGKNLVGFMLESAGFTVVDIGVDVSTAGFVQAVCDHQPQVLGMSALLTTMLGMQDVQREVQRLFDQLGPGGGYILSPSDHFFAAPAENLRAYAEAARACRYG